MSDLHSRIVINTEAFLRFRCARCGTWLLAESNLLADADAPAIPGRDEVQDFRIEPCPVCSGRSVREEDRMVEWRAMLDLLNRYPNQ